MVAKLEPVNTARATNDSILVNCHFDTKPGSPGATDNMISCATMLEVLRVLAGEIPTSLKNPIVFLFNGAEELGLQGAHGFVKGYEGSLGYPENGVLGHRWSKNLRTFINLEGAGGGGREILFQTGPGVPLHFKNYLCMRIFYGASTNDILKIQEMVGRWKLMQNQHHIRTVWSLQRRDSSVASFHPIRISEYFETTESCPDWTWHS